MGQRGISGERERVRWGSVGGSVSSIGVVRKLIKLHLSLSRVVDTRHTTHTLASIDILAFDLCTDKTDTTLETGTTVH